nr:hypothetical protein [Tanacetum cinerariifolium]
MMGMDLLCSDKARTVTFNKVMADKNFIEDEKPDRSFLMVVCGAKFLLVLFFIRVAAVWDQSEVQLTVNQVCLLRIIRDGVKGRTGNV